MQRTTHPEVLTIGETMVLVAPLVAEALEIAKLFRLEAGGAESNVAVQLAALGFRSGSHDARYAQARSE